MTGIQLVIISAALLCSGQALAQSIDPDEALMLEEELLKVEAVPESDDAAGPLPIAELPTNVIEVRTKDGFLSAPYVESENCTSQGCQPVIVNNETNAIVYAQGIWMPGFLETKNGAQIVKLVTQGE